MNKSDILLFLKPFLKQVFFPCKTRVRPVIMFYNHVEVEMPQHVRHYNTVVHFFSNMLLYLCRSFFELAFSPLYKNYFRFYYAVPKASVSISTLAFSSAIFFSCSNLIFKTCFSHYMHLD